MSWKRFFFLTGLAGLTVYSAWCFDLRPISVAKVVLWSLSGVGYIISHAMLMEVRE